MADTKAPSMSTILAEREDFFECFGPEDTDTEEFYEQSIENRSPGRRREPGKYFPIIRVPASQLLQPLSVESVYEYWCKTGKIATKQSDRELRGVDINTMLGAYPFGLEMSRERCADYRDAVLDAVAKHLDVQLMPDWTLVDRVFKAVESVPNFSLERLAAFYVALSVYPPNFISKPCMEDKQFRHRVQEQIKALPEGVPYYDIWDDFLLYDRCKFHEHPSGKCWRPTESGPEVAPPEDKNEASLQVPRWKWDNVEVDLGEVE